jgi:hypothetical protein
MTSRLQRPPKLNEKTFGGGEGGDSWVAGVLCAVCMQIAGPIVNIRRAN